MLIFSIDLFRVTLSIHVRACLWLSVLIIRTHLSNKNSLVYQLSRTAKAMHIFDEFRH